MSGDISIIMPALNEEKNLRAAIENVFEGMKAFSIQGEIVVINDGSTDSTQDIIREYQAKFPETFKSIRHEIPRGIGASFWEGVDIASCDSVVMLPGDNENDSKEIFRYGRLLDHVDMVIPFVFNRDVRSFHRNLLSFLYRFIINTTFLVNFNYTNGTVLYRRSILKQIPYRSTGFFFQTDILIRMVKKGYLFAEVPYRLSMRESGKSKAVSFPSLVQVAKGYMRLVKNIYTHREAKTLASLDHESLTARRYEEAQQLGHK